MANHFVRSLKRSRAGVSFWLVILPGIFSQLHADAVCKSEGVRGRCSQPTGGELKQQYRLHQHLENEAQAQVPHAPPRLLEHLRQARSAAVDLDCTSREFDKSAADLSGPGELIRVFAKCKLFVVRNAFGSATTARWRRGFHAFAANVTEGCYLTSGRTSRGESAFIRRRDHDRYEVLLPEGFFQEDVLPRVLRGVLEDSGLLGEEFVVNNAMHPEQEQELMDLHTANASLTVTSCHRVMVRKGNQAQPLPACSLRLGEHVLLAGNRFEELIKMEKVVRFVSVVDLAFNPDEAIETFPPARESILSKWRGTSRTRRGRKPNDPKAHDDYESIPATEDSWMYECG